VLQVYDFSVALEADVGWGLVIQVEALKRDSARLVAENNQLHLQLMSHAEQYGATLRQNYHQSKRLEDQLAELSFVKQKTLERYLAREKENDGLKEKLASVAKLLPAGTFVTRGATQICY
jgi:hypothetical protein